MHGTHPQESLVLAQTSPKTQSRAHRNEALTVGCWALPRKSWGAFSEPGVVVGDSLPFSATQSTRRLCFIPLIPEPSLELRIFLVREVAGACSWPSASDRTQLWGHGTYRRTGM